ncbi:MAG: hypothetical protein HZB57_02205 [Gammaproteobacteria bacterium]|nr:hypothetical protein [Gammaproteobacteria bacterium]
MSVRRHLPRHWSPLIRRRNADWSMVDRQDAECVVGSLRLLRQIPNYYLRSLTLCLVAGLVTLAFNCDGTQIVRASAYREFLAENGVGMNDF